MFTSPKGVTFLLPSSSLSCSLLSGWEKGGERRIPQLLAAQKMAICLSMSGGPTIKTPELRFSRSPLFAYTPRLAAQRKLNQFEDRNRLSIRAEYRDGGRGGGSDFLAGFLLGGAVFGTLAYLFAPQIRRSLLNEDEYGFRRAKRPIYYDEGLEKTRQTLNAKINQLNSAIDNVSSRLRGGNNSPPSPVETDPEVEANL